MKYIFIILIILFPFTSCDNGNVEPWDYVEWFNTENEHIYKLYEKQNTNEAKRQIVFCGDSGNVNFPFDKLLPAYSNTIVNRNISGSTSTLLLSYMDRTILPLEPSKVFFQIGSNDLQFGTSKEETKANILAIYEKFKETNPVTKVYFLSIYPVNPSADIPNNASGTRTKEKLMQYNEEIKVLLQEKAIFVDVYHDLTDENGYLKREYTIDGIHFTEAGWAVVADKLKEFL